jgi:anti-sigma B factor antagonist
MTTNLLETRVRHQPGISVVTLRGEINTFAEQTLDDAYAEACTGNPGVILLDFKQVDYINSTGIALIVSLLAKSRATNCRLVACGLSEHYQEIFQITRLADFMSIYPDQGSALAQLATQTVR